MRTSYRRQPPSGCSNLTSWQEAYQTRHEASTNTHQVYCLYEGVSEGEGETVEEATEDFLENVRLKISELTDLLEYCSKRKPREIK